MVIANSPSIEDMTQTIHLDPEAVKEQFDRIGHFRILVVGRSNAGKTTLLQPCGIHFILRFLLRM